MTTEIKARSYNKQPAKLRYTHPLNTSEHLALALDLASLIEAYSRFEDNAVNRNEIENEGG